MSLNEKLQPYIEPTRLLIEKIKQHSADKEYNNV